MNKALGVDMEQRGNDVRRDLLDSSAKLIGDFRNRNFVGKRRHDQLLQRPQLPAFGDVGQQRDDVLDLATRIAKRLDVGPEPDLFAVRVVGKDFLVDAAFALDAALQPLQYGAIGVWPGDQLINLPALGL